LAISEDWTELWSYLGLARLSSSELLNITGSLRSLVALELDTLDPFEIERLKEVELFFAYRAFKSISSIAFFMRSFTLSSRVKGESSSIF